MDLLRTLLQLPTPASALARDIDALHVVVITLTFAGAACVALAAAAMVWRYRRRTSVALPTPRVVFSARWELVSVGGIVILFVALWVVGFRQYIRLEVPPAGTQDIYVVAKQWMWKFSYADGTSAASLLTVPAGTPVKLVMTSRDVIHSFFVPALRLKQDVVPNRYTTLWFVADRPGVYPILCAEYCGLSHSNMAASLAVLAPEDYVRWQSARQTPGTVADGATPSLARLGEDVAVRHGCLACHTTDGTRHIGPTWRGLFGRERALADGSTVRADAAYLTESMMEPRAKVVAGYAAVMPTYWGILSPTDAAAIVEYIKSLHGTPRDAVFPDPTTLRAQRDSDDND